MKISKKMLNRFIAGCMALFVAITAFPVNSYAKDPTLETTYQELTVGNNQMKINGYNDNKDTMLGCFVAPETGKYSITVANNGEVKLYARLLDDNLSKIDSVKRLYLATIKKGEFENISLKKNQKIYVHIDAYSYGSKLLSAKVTIKQTNVTPQLNKTAVSLARNKKVTLKLKNNKKKVIWVSSNKKIATVTSKGVVKAKKKGTAYIYAIANHKLYKCKVSVYR